MELSERIAKFDKFLTNFEKASGATGICEAVRSAAKICFEGLTPNAPWADPGLIDPKYKNNVVASSSDIHRKMFHDIPLAKYKARMAAKRSAAPAATESAEESGDANVETAEK